MNNLNYKEAVTLLKVLEADQRIHKNALRVTDLPLLNRYESEMRVEINRGKINLVLSVIHAHKKAMKLYSKVSA